MGDLWHEIDAGSVTDAVCSPSCFEVAKSLGVGRAGDLWRLFHGDLARYTDKS